MGTYAPQFTIVPILPLYTQLINFTRLAPDNLSLQILYSTDDVIDCSGALFQLLSEWSLPSSRVCCLQSLPQQDWSLRMGVVLLLAALSCW